MPRLAPRLDPQAHNPLVPARKLQLRRLPEDDRLPREAQAVSGAHPVAADLFAHDEEQRHVALGNGPRAEEGLDGFDLCRYAAFGVDAAAAPDLGAAKLVWPVGRDGVDVGGHERSRLACRAGVGEDVVSGMLGLGCPSYELGLDGEVLVREVGDEELADGVFVVGY